MLVLSRKVDEKVIIGEGASRVEVMVLEVRGDKVRLGFTADRSVTIHREEVRDRIQSARTAQVQNPEDLIEIQEADSMRQSRSLPISEPGKLQLPRQSCMDDEKMSQSDNTEFV